MANTITFTDITNHCIFQRIGTVGSINVSGGFDNTGTTPSSIEFQIINYNDSVTIIKDWFPIASLVVGVNFWNGIASNIPQGGPYKINFRSKDSGGNVLATGTLGSNEFLVGDLFAVAGASSFDRFFSDGTYTLTATTCRRYFPTNPFGNPAGSQVWSTFPGTNNGPVINFCNLMYAIQGVPIGVLGFGVSGSDLDDWQSTQVAWTTFVSGITAVGGKVLAVYLCILNDLGGTTVNSQSSFETRYRTVIANTRIACGNPKLPIILISYQRVAGAPDDQTAWVRTVEKAIQNTDKNTFVNFRIDALPTPDFVHVDTASLLTDSNRMVNTWKYINNNIQYCRGPYVSKAFYSGSGVSVKIAHRGGNDFGLSGLGGFSALDSSGIFNISNVARKDSQTVTFNINRPISGQMKVQNVWTAFPNTTGMVFDNASPLSLPLEPCEIVASSGDIICGTWL